MLDIRTDSEVEKWKNLTELSLFTGGGGGLIATSLFMGIRTIGMVEFNEDAQNMLLQRQKDNMLDKCPIFGDIREFIKQGFAESYKGMVDLVTGGFPCQPFSSSGQRAAQNDPRNMWPSTREVIRIVQPRFFFLENVANLLHFPYIQQIFGEMAEIGYNVAWTVLSAKDIGAFHGRNRIWFLGQRGDDSHS